MKNSNYLALLAGLVLVGGCIAGCDNKKAEGLRIVTGEEFEQNLRTFVQERNSRR